MLGLRPDASPEQVAARYRSLAKRFHPDRAGGRDAERRMAQINAAYDAVRAERRRARRAGLTHTAPAPSPAAPAPPRRPAGWWLDPATRAALGPELVAALGLRERVDRVVPTSTWAGAALLAVTDRRLLWLHDDAVTGRIRSLRWADVESADVRRGWPRRSRSTVRVRRRGGRRGPAFSELEPEDAEALAASVRERTQA